MKFAKTLTLGACFFVTLGAEIASEAPLKISLLREAHAVIGPAPGGSVVRRRVVVTAASSSANANAAATANANAAAAAAKPPPPADPAAPLPVGTAVTTLPPGCAPTTLNAVEYQRCGSTYYRPSMQGSNLVYVVSQP